METIEQAINSGKINCIPVSKEQFNKQRSFGLENRDKTTTSKTDKKIKELARHLLMDFMDSVTNGKDDYAKGVFHANKKLIRVINELESGEDK